MSFLKTETLALQSPKHFAQNSIVHEVFVELDCMEPSQMARVVNNLPDGAGDGRRLGFDPLGGEDPLGEGMATHSSTLAWRIPWTEKRGRLQSMGLQRVGQD